MLYIRHVFGYLKSKWSPCFLFIIMHSSCDRLLAGFVIVRSKLIKLSSGIFNENTQHMFIELMNFYNKCSQPHTVFSEYIRSRYANVDRRSSDGIYLSQLEFCFQYRSELYENYMRENVTALSNRLAELIAFVTTHRVNNDSICICITLICNFVRCRQSEFQVKFFLPFFLHHLIEF